MEKRIKELGLRKIEITEGANGYPKNCHPAVIGFDNFKQAEQFVKDFGGEICDLRVRDGHHLWENRCWTDEPIRVTPSDFVGDVILYTHSEAEDFFSVELDKIKNYYSDDHFDCFGCFRDHFKWIEKTYEKIKNLGNNEQLALCLEGEDIGIYPIRTMQWYYDVWTYAVGVVLDREEE